VEWTKAWEGSQTIDPSILQPKRPRAAAVHSRWVGFHRQLEDAPGAIRPATLADQLALRQLERGLAFHGRPRVNIFSLQQVSREPLAWRWIGLMGVLFALLLPLPIRAQHSAQWTTNYYTITGASLAEIRQSLRQSRPWKDKLSAEGFTAWRVGWRFAVTPSADGCRCSSFATQTIITTTLPRWIAPTNAPPEVGRAWATYLASLGRHEAGHAQFAFAAAADITKRVGQIGEQPACDSLKKTIDALAGQIVEEYRQREKEYDQRTKHGATQGVFLPESIRDSNRGSP